MASMVTPKSIKRGRELLGGISGAEKRFWRRLMRSRAKANTREETINPDGPRMRREKFDDLNIW